MRGQIGSIFVIDGGDGDQDFFGSPMTARRVAPAWFTGILPRGEAYLLRISGGKYAGEYVAITSRLVESLSDQLRRSKWVSVVVHHVLEPGEGFRPTFESVPAIGMAAVQVYE